MLITRKSLTSLEQSTGMKS